MHTDASVTSFVTRSGYFAPALPKQMRGRMRVYFPAREPHSVKFRSDSGDPGDSCARLFREEIVHIIDSLKLPRYGLSLYQEKTLPADLAPAEIKVLADLSRAGPRLKGFCRTNLFKRLESSVHAFLLSVHRHVLRNELFIHALENFVLPLTQPCFCS